MRIRRRPGALHPARSLRGRTIRWTLYDDRGRASVYHHSFERDGSLVFRGESASGDGTRIRPAHALVGEVAEGAFVVSYLSPPHTLTALLSARTGRVSAIVSSDKFWLRFSGTWEFVAA